jgi:hypothetical protein
MRAFDQVVETLARRKTPLAEILAACPFDPNHNLGGYLTEDLFFDTLFVCTEHFRHVESELLSHLHSPTEHKRVISCTGFSGIGKTTFLKYFQRTATHFHHISLDCSMLGHHGQTARPPTAHAVDDVCGSVDTLVADAAFSQLPPDLRAKLIKAQHDLGLARDDENPILGILKSYLNTIPDDDLRSVLYFLSENRAHLAAYLSGYFVGLLATVATTRIAEHRGDLLNSANLSDTFTLFFLHLFLHYDQSKPFLIYFDNLDAVEIEYLSNDFKEAFLCCLTDAAALGQESVFCPKIDFVRQYRFVFCLRDGNAGVFNTHLLDNVGNTVTTIDFRLTADGAAYESILETRLQLWAAIAGHTPTVQEPAAREPSADSIIGAMRALKNDRYFRLVLTPLFNGDLRRIIQMIFTVARELASSGAADIFGRLAEIHAAEMLEQYGLRGSLVFGIVNYLRQKERVVAYPFFDSPIIGERGECLSSRMILTVLLNHSGLQRSSDIELINGLFQGVSLRTVIEEASPLYGANDVVRTLVEAFFFHRSNWVNLVSFRNRAIVKRNAFDRDLVEGFERLDRVLVLLNPSGFVYLKNVVPHFEFMSVLAGNTRPLFSVDLEKASRPAPKVEYLFEEMQLRTLKLVKQRVAEMAGFYRRVVVGEAKWDSGQYLRSAFAFKHGGDGAPWESGVFHAFRLLTSHINYIDRYRLFLNRRHQGEAEVIVKVNRAIAYILERYIAVNDVYPEFRSEEPFGTFVEQLRKLRESGFGDSTINISMRPPRGEGGLSE